jgi:hypothetical protein
MYPEINHVMHAAILVVILYVVMFYFLGQSDAKAMSRSVLIGAFALAYMVMYGHKVLGAVNPRLGF